MKNLNELERLGIAHKVTDILINNGCGGHQEEWWDVRNDISERAEAFKDGSMEEFADYLICNWCTKGRYDLSTLAWEWARQEVYTWDTQQCIDYSGGLDEMIEGVEHPYPDVKHMVKHMSYRSKAWIKFREQVSDLWHEDPQAYAHIWEPMTPYNVVRKEVIEILNNVSA